MVLLIVAGLAAFTRHAPLTGPLETLAAGSVLGVAVIGLLLGVELVVSKVRSTAAVAERANLVASTVTGGLLAVSLQVDGGQVPPLWLAAPGAAAALVVRLARQRVTTALRAALRPWAHVAVGIASDVLAGSATAAIFAVKP